MKQLILFFLILPFCSFGQDLRIHVMDSDTKEDLPFANIYLKKSGVGASTNMEGIAIFKRFKLKELDSVIVSYIGYDNQAILYSNENDKQLIVVKLKESTQALAEIVLEYVEPPKPKKIIKKALKNIHRNYNPNAVLFHSLYRETIQENGKYIQLNEAIVKTNYTGYPQKKLDRTIWEDWYYDDSYAFDLEGDYHTDLLLKDFNTKKDKQIVVASRHSNNKSVHNIETTQIGDPLILFALDKIKYQYDFLNPKVLNKYKFIHQDSKIINGEECYSISFYPKSTIKNFKRIQSKKNKYPIYIGELYISKKTNALLKFRYKLAVDRDFGFFSRRIPLDYQVEMNYKKYGNVYGIENIKLSQLQKVGKKDNGESILHLSKKELYILKSEKENNSIFPDSSLFKSTRFSSLRYYKKNYNPEYWNTMEWKDTLQLSNKIIKDLEIHKPLKDQFIENKNIKKQNLQKPKVYKEFYSFNYHNKEIIDSLHWMSFPKNENKLKKYLAIENIYAKNELIEDKKYQKKLFKKLNNFYLDNTKSDSKHEIGSYFFDEDSLNNTNVYFQKDTNTKISLFNISEFENRNPNTFIKQFIPNLSNNKILILYDKVGIINNFASVFSFGKSTTLDNISSVQDAQWYSDSTLLYTKSNSLGRAESLYYRNYIKKIDTLIYSETDPEFDVEINKIDTNFICTVQSKTENEIYFINKNSSSIKVDLIHKREKGVLMDISIKNGLYLLKNNEKKGSSIHYRSPSNFKNSELLSQANKQDYITEILPTRNNIIALVYEKSIQKLKYLKKDNKKWKDFNFKLGIGRYNLISVEDSTNSFYFSFESFSNPYTKYKYNLNTSELHIVTDIKTIKPIYYKYCSTERIWAKSVDGVKVPITIIKNRTAANKGLILKVYGAYGAYTTPSFDAQDAILLEQGFILAYAHVRGESILGQAWYKSGRELQKKNSILDYISCAEYLIRKKYTSPNSLIGYGNSAGGLVVAQAINLRPELFNTVILDRPFLDVINTMMNDSLPLTISEYKEWGNPQKKEVYEYIQQYSPFQNIRKQAYPNVLLIASYQDYQTPIWQIAKYTSKLRENNLSTSDIILLTDMNSGHYGNTKDKEWIKLFSKTYSFIKLKNHL